MCHSSWSHVVRWTSLHSHRSWNCSVCMWCWITSLLSYLPYASSHKSLYLRIPISRNVWIRQSGRERGHLYVHIFPAPRGREKCAVPLLILLIASLGLGTAGALSRQQAQQWPYDSYKNLGCQITQGLFALEGSIARLEDWVVSLAEVVLQYYRATLGLLCAEQGGYCMVFGETCCFYENHSGITMNNLAKNTSQRGKSPTRRK